MVLLAKYAFLLFIFYIVCESNILEFLHKYIELKADTFKEFQTLLSKLET